MNNIKNNNNILNMNKLFNSLLLHFFDIIDIIRLENKILRYIGAFNSWKVRRHYHLIPYCNLIYSDYFGC